MQKDVVVSEECQEDEVEEGEIQIDSKAPDLSKIS